MATFLDLMNIGFLSNIFVFLLVFVIAYVAMLKTGAFKEKEGMAAIIAFVLGILLIMSKPVVNGLVLAAPWITFLLIFIFIIMLLFALFGATEKDFMTALKHDNNVLLNSILWGGIIIGGIAFLVGMLSSFSEETQSFLYSLLTDLRILGIIVTFLIAFFAILLITGAEAPVKK